MRAIRNTAIILTGIILVTLGGYYLHRRDVAASKGGEYPITSAPGDLLSEIASIFGKDETSQPEGFGPVTVGTTAKPTGSGPKIHRPPDFAAWEQAREAYLAGHYENALSLALRSRSGAPADQVTRLEMRSRLFMELLAGAEPDATPDGPPIALLVLKNGESMFVNVLDETEEAISFRNAKGLGATLPKAGLADFTVASTPAKKAALYEGEYQRRHSDLRGGAAALELARYCRRHGLDDHLTYLLERAMDTGDKGVETALFERYQEVQKASGSSQARGILDLMKHFFRSSELTRKAVLDALPSVPPRPGFDTTLPDENPAGSPPPSGIGGRVERTPRVSNPEINALLARADGLRLEGNDYFEKTYPGHPDRVKNREKALACFDKAIEIYEQVEEGWKVNLDNVFKDLMTKRYQLLKDKPVR